MITDKSISFSDNVNKTKKQIGHHARPRRASATAPLRTGTDMCKTGSGAGKRAGPKSDPFRRRGNHAWTEDQAGKRKCANTDAVGGWRVHTVDDTPSDKIQALQLQVPRGHTYLGLPPGGPPTNLPSLPSLPSFPSFLHHKRPSAWIAATCCAELPQSSHAAT